MKFKKLKKLLMECPILIGITLIAILLTVVAWCFKDTAYAGYAGEETFGKHPALAYVLRGARDNVFPWSAEAADPYDAGMPDETVQESAIGDDEALAEGEESIPEGDEENAGGDSDTDTSFASDDGGDISGNDAQEEEIVYEFTDVDDDYFCDALFIGDSRTVGLSEYCEELDSRATFYSKVSLTIYTCMDKEFVKTDEGNISVDQALRENQFGKIYIMLGLNEIGTGDTQYFKDAYEEVLGRIMELQPDAIIYIQGIMHVSAKKSEHDKYFNNETINERNAALAELADQKRIFYIDMNEAVDDGNGNLDGSLSFDDVHLKASSYERWHEFLLHNAIVR